MVSDHPAIMPPPKVPDQHPNRDGLLIAVAVVVGAVVVIGGLLTAQRLWADDADIDAAATADPTVPPATVPPPTTAPADRSDSESSAGDTPEGNVEPLPCPDDVAVEICEAADFVQQARGRPFQEFPQVELLDGDAFGAELTNDLADARDEIESNGTVLAALGLIDDDLDLYETFETLLDAGVVGFYRPESGQLVVRGGDFDLYRQLVLVHELVHAFDDQWHDLDRDFEHSDADYGFAAVVEGNASRVESEWRAQLTAAEQATLADQELSAVRPEDLIRIQSVPQAVLALQFSPYSDGEIFVADLVARGGEAAVDNALDTPPSSSEQILHPELIGRPEGEVVTVAPPRPEADRLSDGTLGELVIGLWLGRSAAAGWGGDAYAVWDDDGTRCLTVDIAADDATDLAEIAEAARRWAELDDGRAIEDTSADGQPLIRITGC